MHLTTYYVLFAVFKKNYHHQRDPSNYEKIASVSVRMYRVQPCHAHDLENCNKRHTKIHGIIFDIDDALKSSFVQI